jgi:hypothetical protein
MAPLPADLPPLTAWSDVHQAAAEAVRRFTTPPPITRVSITSNPSNATRGGSDEMGVTFCMQSIQFSTDALPDTCPDA